MLKSLCFPVQWKKTNGILSTTAINRIEHNTITQWRNKERVGSRIGHIGSVDIVQLQTKIFQPVFPKTRSRKHTVGLALIERQRPKPKQERKPKRHAANVETKPFSSFASFFFFWLYDSFINWCIINIYNPSPTRLGEAKIW